MRKEPIAIIGMGCRFPGEANDHKDFWKLLVDGRDAIVDIPSDRWDKDALFDPDSNRPGKLSVKQGGFINDISLFDANFFGISPIEAKRIDPLQRLILETTYQAFEDAGLKMQDLAGTNTGVFIGNSASAYMEITHGYRERANIGPTSNTGIAASIIANRISYVFDLQGPSFSLDTACSSTLVALHQACNSIWRNESSMAIVGGGNLILKPEWHIGFSKGGFLSPDCRCKAFDKTANGYVMAEGVGVVILKPLRQALADGDRIYAEILGSAINEGGKAPGITIPSQKAQIKMLEQAYKEAGIDPAEVQYIEAHGTGTPVGDPKEANAVGIVIGYNKKDGDCVYIGSVKTNVGHLESASGMPGLIKAVLSLVHKKIPKNLHFEEGNPEIAFDKNKVKVPTELVDWPNPEKTLYAGVNSFGFGGVNAHVVLKEGSAIRASKKRHQGFPHIFVISAKTKPALKALAKKYIQYLTETSADLADICYSLLTRRTILEQRLSIVAKSKEQVLQQLESYINDETKQGLNTDKFAIESKKIAFVFSGQGPQWWGMGRGLLKKNKLFRKKVNEIDKILKGLGWLKEEQSSLVQELLKDEERSRINETAIAQPAIFAIQVALYELWLSLGVKPEAIVGHSIGEVAASYATGALGLEDATRVVYWRSKCQTVLEGKGKMLAVGMQAEDIQAELTPDINIAAINGPKSVTLSGDAHALEKLADKLTKQDIFNRFLRVTVPFHSYFTEIIKDEFINSLGKVNTKTNNITLYSTVTGKKINGLELNAGYWYKNIRQTVEFYPALRRMIQEGYNMFVEQSPHPILAIGINDTLSELNKSGFSLPSLRRNEDEELVFFTTLGKLIIADCQIDLKRLCFIRNKYVDLPYYAWQREKYWLETDESRKERLGSYIHPHLIECKSFVKEPNDIIWQVNLNKFIEPYLDDHRVQGAIVYPAAGHLDLALSVAKLSFGNEYGLLEDIHLEKTLLIPDEGTAEVQLEVASDTRNYILYLRPKDANDQWIKCSYGRISRCQCQSILPAVNLDAVQERLTNEAVVEKRVFYNLLGEDSVQFGETYQVVNKCYYNQQESLTELELNPRLTNNFKKFTFHPTIFDGSIHSALVAFQALVAHDSGIFLPTAISKINFNFTVPVSPRLWSYAQLISYDKKKAIFDLWIFNEGHQLIAEINNISYSYIEGTRKDERNIENYFYNYRWHLKKLEDFPPSISSGKWLILQHATNICKEISAFFAHQPNCHFVTEINDISKHLDVAKIVYLGGLDERVSIDSELLQVKQAQTGGDLLNLLHQINSYNITSAIFVVTNGVEQVKGLAERMSPLAAPLWGLTRVVMNEYPHLKVKLIDLSLKPKKEELISLIKEIASPHGEEISLRGEDRYIHVLEKLNQEQLTEEAQKSVNALGHPYNTVVGAPKSIDNLYLKEFLPRELKEGEVEIKVHAAALNFRDVMLAMGMLSNEAVAGGLYGRNLGLECAGEITKLGAKVKDFKVGEKVIACSSNCLGGIIYADESQVVKQPAYFSHEEAATIMTVYLTAYYSLNYLCRMGKGDKVLVHAGAGGVGIAAIKLANLVGAEVFATVGNEAKRRYLQSLGVKHIMNSRDLTFKDAIMKVTDGYGVDIVINSIAGEAITQSISCLAPYGRFVEIGKVDIYNDKRIGLKPFGNNLAYFAVDADRLLKQKPKLAQQMMQEVMALFYAKKLDAHPYEKFPISKIKDAFRYLGQSKQVGKVVVTMTAEEKVAVYPPAAMQFKKEGAYLITGGCGGFGLAIATFLVTKGVRTLILMGRNGLRDQEAAAIVEKMRQQGANVIIAKADVTNEQALGEVIDNLKSKQIKLKGIIHAATVFDDAPLKELNEERYRKVVEPKMLGAWNLHRATLQEDLDYFVMFSSVSAVYGNPGQGNYAAGNAFLDKFACYRRSLGLPANTINWGVIGEAGYVSRSDKVQAILKSQGWTAFSMGEAQEILERIILDNPADRIAIHVDWQKVGEFFPHTKNSERFGLLTARGGAREGGNQKKRDSLKEQFTTLSGEEQSKTLASELQKVIARITGADLAQIEMDTSLTNMGIDSLMATQLKNWIQSNLEVSYPIMKIMQISSITSLTIELLAHVLKNHETASSLAASLTVTSKENAKTTIGDERELSLDCVLDDTIRPATPYLLAQQISNIFITGATGFLGAFLIKDLLEQTVANIYCLVRASSESDGLSRIKNNLVFYQCWHDSYQQRIIPVLGDLAQPLLGISPKYFTKLSFTIDTIYHVGVLANFIYSYADLRSTNVLSVVEALRFACQNKTKPFHYVSSFSVFFNPSHANQTAYENDLLSSGSGYFLGYIASKWVGEKIVRIAEQRGLPITIYRPGEITGATTTGIWKMADMMSHYFVTAVRLGAAAAMTAKIYFTPVDYISKAIAHLSLQKESFGKAFHLVNNNIKTLPELVSIINEFGYDLAIVSFAEWKKKIEKWANKGNALTSFETVFTSEHMNRLELSLNYDTQNVLHGLQGTGIVCPPVSQELVFKYLRSFIAQGYIPEPLAQKKKKV